jgi:GT2 family glycosyltransferase
MSPDVSAIVISRSEGENLRDTVANLPATLPVGSEIVAVDDASSDGSAEFLGPAYPAVRLVRTPERIGVARARNHRARSASGECRRQLAARRRRDDAWLIERFAIHALATTKETT